MFKPRQFARNNKSRFLNNKNKNSAEGVIAPAGAKVTGATIRTWLLNKFISFLAVLSWKTGLKKCRQKCLVGHIYSRRVPFPLMAISSALTFRIIQPNAVIFLPAHPESRTHIFALGLTF